MMTEKKQFHIPVINKKNSRLCLTVCIFILFVFTDRLSMAEEEKDTITWLRHDDPPGWITQGADAGTGAEDFLMKLFIEKLNNYKHKIITVNHNRAVAMMTDGDNVCQTGRMKTPDREKYMYFSSVPSTIAPGIGVILHKNRQLQAGTEKSLSLADMLRNKKLKLGVVENRKYGKEIDNILNHTKEGMRIYKRSKGDFAGLFEMLRVNRIDVILGHDWEFQYTVSKLRTGEINDYIWIPVQEADPYEFGYTVCSKTEWGKEVIRKISKIILKERMTDRYRNFWLQRVSDQKLYNKYYDEIFLKCREE